MKKILLYILLVVTLSVTALAGVEYTLSGIDYSVVVNGEAMAFTDAVPMNYNGRTMLPLRAVSEALDIPIEWDGKQVNIETLDLDKLKESCVLIKMSADGQNFGNGSGVLIDYDEILTAAHVVNGYSYVSVNYNSSNIDSPCSLVDAASNKDSAILTPPNKTVKPVKIGDSDDVKIGDKVYVVSSPNWDKNVVTDGEIILTGIFKGVYVFATTALTKNGSSGGACFNFKGELIGMVTGGADDNSLSYMIPINDIRKALAN